MLIGELFLGAFLQVLFERLVSRELLNFAQREGIDMLLKEWERMLIGVNQVLDDAEDRQLNGDLGVKSWLEDLRNLAYDIEDLLDEFALESAENKSEAEPGTSKVRSLLPSFCFRLSPRAFMFNRKMRSKIEEMDGRLQKIITLKDHLSLRENDEKRSAYRRQNKPIPTTHLTDKFFIGRKDKKEEMLDLLTREEDARTCMDIKVIPIVGMSGLGKTALAQQVYNDARVSDYFDVRAWACVSVDFDMLTITKSILQTINPHLPCEGKDLDWLQDNLKKNLLGKTFLIVLDDVWNKNYDHWTTVLKPFQSGAKKSKIIITTRNLEVASIAGAPPITLELLSLDDCMILLAFHALGAITFYHHPDLVVIGRKIVEKCKGLPLAVKTLAGLLRTKVSFREWKAILNSKIWDLSKERSNILPALKLSYLDLPSHLRRCFVYCAIIPKNYEIERDELIHWWIAEGLLKGKEVKDPWNAGVDYFNELVSRSLFQKSSSNGSRFFMHDLVNDLAKLVAGETYFDLTEFKGDHNNALLARHASFIPTNPIVLERLEIYHGMEGLRSFISLKKLWCYFSVSQEVLCDLLSRLKYLRVLSLSHYEIKEVPNCIGELKHLRHLNLSYTDIERLPQSIIALYNLEALMLRSCRHLVQLPEGMEKLINLRFLDITDTQNLRAMPLYIGNLVGLEMLSKFVVGTENGSRLKQLENLKNLRGELCIFDLHKVHEAGDANDANLRTKEGICQLTMQWSTDFENFRNGELEVEVLEFLRPHQNLANLTISYYGGIEFSSWLGRPSHVNLVQLCLRGCGKAKALPSLGRLSSLKELYIEGLNAICTVGSEFYDSRSPFPSLITLEFKNMPLWEDWSYCVGTEEVGIVFPCLEHLVIRNCPMLIGRLPSQLSFLVKLEIVSCPRMDASPSIISLPSLNKLNFGGCNEGVLKSLGSMMSLTALALEDVAGLTCLNHGSTSSLIKLERLELIRCTELIYLWQDRDVIQNLTCLKSLVVNRCPEFIYLVAGEGDVELPGNLETIELTNCVNLEKLPSKMHTLSSLRCLTISYCPKLVSFPETGIPPSVIRLEITNCQMLQSLPRGLSIHPDESSSSSTLGDMTSCLQELRISECNSLATSLFNEGSFLPTTLKRLEVWNCIKVESLAEINLDGLQRLQMIDIIDCRHLRSLPQGLHTLSHLTFLRVANCTALELDCFPPLPPSISIFHLSECPKIKSLPNQLHRLTCLSDLRIIMCEGITCFPDGGLPAQLQILKVRGCKNMRQPMREWLTPLTSLQSLEIGGSAGEEEDLVLALPSSLLYLGIFYMENVERLSSSLPPSLRTLEIRGCPKLRELPRDGLPPSLKRLEIYDCGNLKEQRRPNKKRRSNAGHSWPLIRKIPRLGL